MPEYYIVTGGTSGIGLEAAKALAAKRLDAVVVITGRKAPTETLPSNIELRTFDLGNLAEVKAFVEGWDHPVSALLLNAGLSAGELEYIDGVERTLAVNHLGGAELLFALDAKGLLPPSARIIFTSSGLHAPFKGNPFPPAYTTAADVAAAKTEQQKVPATAYSNSKLANVLFAYALSRHAAEREQSKDWSVIAMCPGFIPASNLTREAGILHRIIFTAFSYLPALATWATGTVSSTTERSGKALADLATDEAHRDEKMVYYELEQKKDSSEQSHDIKLQDDLWDWTVNKLGVQAKL